MSVERPSSGDWVRFYRGGDLIIADVQYVRDADYPNLWEALTSRGPASNREILEVRSASLPSPRGQDNG